MGQHADDYLDYQLRIPYWDQPPLEPRRTSVATVTRQHPRPKKRQVPARPQPKRLSRPTGTNTKMKGEPDGFFGKPPVVLMVYGPSGVGKSSLFAHWPDPAYIIDPDEDGIQDLVEWNQVPEPRFIETVEDHDSHLALLHDIAARRNCRTLVEDSLTGFEKLCFLDHAAKYFDGDFSKDGFFAYQQGPVAASKLGWSEYIAALRAVWQAGINVVLIAHSQQKTVSSPNTLDYDKFFPYLQKDTWQQLHRWCKTVLFYNMEAEIKKKGLKGKAVEGSEQRILYTTKTAYWDAKNRYGLPPYINLGDSAKEAAQDLINAIRKGGRRV